jgi:hypothetical protein
MANSPELYAHSETAQNKGGFSVFVQHRQTGIHADI